MKVHLATKVEVSRGIDRNNIATLDILNLLTNGRANKPLIDTVAAIKDTDIKVISNFSQEAQRISTLSLFKQS